jgi:hypothetical protein
MSTKYFLIDENQLKAIKELATKLYSENRMDGNEMRNAAQMLDGIHRLAKEFELNSVYNPASPGM